MAVYFHKDNRWVTADSDEELGIFAHKLNVPREAMRDGYCALTIQQRIKAGGLGSTVDDATFNKLVDRLNKEVEI